MQVVEDDPSILKIVSRMLKSLGYNVLCTNVPREAMRLFEQHTTAISLLLTDVVMPQINGRDLSQQFQKICPNLKTLFMSGYTANVIAHRGVLDEGVHFIQKPLLKRDLAVKIRKILEEEKG